MVVPLRAVAADVIEVAPVEGDATAAIQAAIDEAARLDGREVIIKLRPGNYDISREHASRHLYHISNTASAEENPDRTKHVGLWFRDMKNVTFDGDGTLIVTHGEMTPIVVDGCSGITLRNFTLTAADPSVPEFKVVGVDPHSMTVEITPPSRYEIDASGNFMFVGEGWRFADGGRITSYPEFAQVFYPDANVTLRCESPLKERHSARSLGENIVRFEFDRTPDVHVGEIYQLRHGIRNEACGFFNRSRDITIENVEFNFLGNFGLVGQYSENLTYDNIRCRPRLGSGRTDAGFADFVQMSGCRGLVRIINSCFEGAHDDPINIHGTHLRIEEADGENVIKVRFMHGQTYGFEPFFKDDKVEIVDRHTLNCLAAATVKAVSQVDDYCFQLTLDRPLPRLPEGYDITDLAVENVTWTPDVEIRNNYFARIPTRGILITTRGSSVIEDNIFFRMPMPAILVSDDARGWYESGQVKSLTIRRNTFIECASPVIAVTPEIDRFDRPVHSGISILDNRFILKEASAAIRLDAADNVRVAGNVFELPAGKSAAPDTFVEAVNTSRLTVGDNRTVSTP
ncbi:MAG: right-handed parallel beta-helix repeat-containing protein [Duncaniella sp.]|nr:right-handed parallel beta-helix repeat-containing protein [Duncaniella sp.]